MTSDRAPRILVLQHIAVEHPGVFGDFLAEDGVVWQAVELDAGETLPELDGYDGLWVFGGPMDVWEEAEHPWLAGEKAFIGEAVGARGLPYLGVCLGHQLLAVALGGEVGRAETPEIGVMQMHKTEEGRRSAFLQDLPQSMTGLQWHGAEVKEPPTGAVTLATTPACRVQAMSLGETAFSVQYHVEVTPTTVTDWSAIPAYKDALERNLGARALPAFEAETRDHMDAFNRDARVLYRNWMRAAFGERYAEDVLVAR